MSHRKWWAFHFFQFTQGDIYIDLAKVWSLTDKGSNFEISILRPLLLPDSVGSPGHEIGVLRTQVREEVPGDGEQRLALPAQARLLLQGQGGAQHAPDHPAKDECRSNRGTNSILRCKILHRTEGTT